MPLNKETKPKKKKNELFDLGMAIGLERENLWIQYSCRSVEE